MKKLHTKNYWDIDMKLLITQIILKSKKANQPQNGKSMNIEAGMFQEGLEYHITWNIAAEICLKQ